MNRILGIIILLAVLPFLSCASGGTSPQGNVQQQQRQRQNVPLWTGEGGKGTSLTVLAPTASGLEEAQNYLLDVVRLEFVSNFSGYSAISVLDWERLQNQYDVLLSGYYDDNAEAGLDLGHLTPTTHIMGGSITRTATGYALQMQITKTADKMTAASYSGTFTFAELDNRTGIRRASLDLLGKMGVTLTETATGELSGAEEENRVNAQTSLAQGIIAQRSGNEWEAVFNYFEARTFDARLPEAAARITSASTSLAANNWQNTGVRDRVLSEIQQLREADRQEAERRRNIEELLKKATLFYKVHQPFEIILPDTFAYSNIDHRRGTVDITVSMNVNRIAEEFSILRELKKQAKSIADVDEEGGWHWPFNFNIRGNDLSRLRYRGRGPAGIWNVTNSLRRQFDDDAGISIEPEFTVTTAIVNEQGKGLKQLSFYFTGIFKPSGNNFFNISLDDGNVTVNNTFTINANDLTDTLTMRIISVNGKSVANIWDSGYVGIPYESAVLGVRTSAPASGRTRGGL